MTSTATVHNAAASYGAKTTDKVAFPTHNALRGHVTLASSICDVVFPGLQAPALQAVRDSQRRECSCRSLTKYYERHAAQQHPSLSRPNFVTALPKNTHTWGQLATGRYFFPPSSSLILLNSVPQNTAETYRGRDSPLLARSRRCRSVQ